MQFMFVEGKYKGKVELKKAALKTLSQYRTIALFSAVQFTCHLPKVRRQLEDIGTKIVTSKPNRTHVESQILGCDCYDESLNIDEEFDAFLYIGDGLFHPRALLLSQKSRHANEYRDVYSYDPLANILRRLSKDDVSSILKKHKASLRKFFLAKNIGVLVSLKPGQQYLVLAQDLAKQYKDKRIYIFVADNMDLPDLENFPFIEVWVNTACPRIGFDDSLNTRKALININDAFNAESLLDAQIKQ